MSSGETPKQPGSDCIEKRSKGEELEQREAKRSRSSLQLPTAPGEPYDDPPTILEFPASAVANAGFLVEKEKLVMYCRENVKALFRFLHDVLHNRSRDFSERDFSENVNPYQLPWIIGPAGAGKSLAVFAFTRSPPVSEWAITWIHSLPGKRFSSCHRYQKVEKTATFKVNQIDEYLAQLKVENQHILVLDGFTNDTSPTNLRYSSECRLKDDFEKRRLFVICSMFGKSGQNHDMRMSVRVFPVCPWTLEEYKAAVREPQLYDAVKEKLGTDTGKSRDEVLASKHYFAGGSARFMFQMDTDKVKEDLDNAIGNVYDIQTLVASLTDWSQGGLTGWSQGFSQYAGNRLAAKLGTQVVEYFNYLYRWKLKGFFFEMLFFAKLSREGLSYGMIDGGPGKTWAKSTPVYLPSKEERLVRESPTWFQPAWNNCGFDAVYVDPQEKTVRFVQITLNNDHAFKIHFFYKFLNRLRNYMHTETLEIFFVYPKGAVPQKPETTGQGLLTKFQWKNGEEWEKVTKVTLEWPG